MSWLIYCKIMSMNAWRVHNKSEQRTWNSNSHLMKSHESREWIRQQQHSYSARCVRAQCTPENNNNVRCSTVRGEIKGIFNCLDMKCSTTFTTNERFKCTSLSRGCHSQFQCEIGEQELEMVSDYSRFFLCRIAQLLVVSISISRVS